MAAGQTQQMAPATAKTIAKTFINMVAIRVAQPQPVSPAKNPLKRAGEQSKSGPLFLGRILALLDTVALAASQQHCEGHNGQYAHRLISRNSDRPYRQKSLNRSGASSV
jgi:hypothetical protein